MTNQIPEAAVEAAAKVLYLEDHLWGEPWETTDAADKYRANALIALDAAAHYMVAQHEAALEAISKVLSDADAFGRQATHHEVMEAMRSEMIGP